MDMSEGTHVKGCGFNFDVAPSLVLTKCLIYQRSECQKNAEVHKELG